MIAREAFMARAHALLDEGLDPLQDDEVQARLLEHPELAQELVSLLDGLAGLHATAGSVGVAPQKTARIERPKAARRRWITLAGVGAAAALILLLSRWPVEHHEQASPSLSEGHETAPRARIVSFHAEVTVDGPHGTRRLAQASSGSSSSRSSVRIETWAPPSGPVGETHTSWITETHTPQQ